MNLDVVSKQFSIKIPHQNFCMDTEDAFYMYGLTALCSQPHAKFMAKRLKKVCFPHLTDAQNAVYSYLNLCTMACIVHIIRGCLWPQSETSIT